MNLWYKVSFMLMAALLLLPACGSAQHVVTDIEETFQGIEEIIVTGGSLEVSYEGAQKEDLFLNAYLESNRRDGPEITYKREGKKLRVEYRRQDGGGWGNLRTKGFISLIGPEDMKMELIGTSGRILVSNVTSDKIELKVSSGKIEARNLASDKIRLSSSSGKIEVEQISGNVECFSSSGGGRISKVNGNVSVEASSGSYAIAEVEGRVDGAVSSGSISLDRVEQLGKLSLSSGSIKATNAGLGETTRFNGSSGSFNIQVKQPLEDFNFDLSASSGSLQVGQTKTGKRLHIDNGSPMTVTGSVSSGRISIQQ